MFGWFGSGEKFKTLTPGEVRDLLRDGSYILVDVREDHEWAKGHIPGALHAPLSRLGEAAGKIPKGKKIIFYCASGMRSKTALRQAKSLALAAEAHLGGGISAWRNQDMPIAR